MVRYSPRAARALAFLKRPYNDIDVFVEDTGNHSMWLVLLRRILPSHIRLSSVNLLGGRLAVVGACRLDQLHSTRSRIYIIDADFDLLLGRPKPRLKHLYRIPAYCIENILLNEKSIIHVGLMTRPTAKEADLARLFAYHEWIKELEVRLTPLFVIYAIAHARCPQVSTISFSVRNLFEHRPQGVSVSSIKTWRRMLQLARSICKSCGIDIFFAEVRTVRTRLINTGMPLAFVSAKDYILPIAMIRMQKAFGFRGDTEQLKVQLASGWDPSSYPGFARRIRALAV